MTNKFPDTIKIQLIKAWIQGISWDKIAQENNIGTGRLQVLFSKPKEILPIWI